MSSIINLSGTTPQGLPVPNHPLECFLRPHMIDGKKMLDAQVLPKTNIGEGDKVFYAAVGNSYPLFEVAKITERRPTNTKFQTVVLDWVRLELL